jgi:histidinol phosphatase-like enzyme
LEQNQLDSLDKLEFYQKHFSIWLKLQLSWLQVVMTNQDGLGTGWFSGRYVLDKISS